MVLPLYDDDSDRLTTPIVNYFLVVFNILVFVFLQDLGENLKFTYAFATVPEEIRTGKDLVDDEPRVEIDPVTRTRINYPPLQPTPVSVYLTLLSSMFMHGSILHLGGNMLFLWIFGDNVEDALGHLRYLAFYLVCGVLASLAHVCATFAFNGDPLIPSLGASGAISGVLGAYILLYPTRRVTVIMFRFLTVVPAYVAIGMWFVFQIVSSIGVLGGSEGGGVAYGAHIGGFLAGAALVKVFAIGRDTDTRPPAAQRWARG